MWTLILSLACLAQASLTLEKTVLQLLANDPEVLVFESRTRDNLTVDMLEHAISLKRNFLIHFTDSDTVLIPNDEYLNSKAPSKMQIIEFNEYDFQELNSATYNQEDLLVPISPCLSFNDADTDGTVSIGFGSRIVVKDYNSGVIGGKVSSIGITYATNVYLINAYTVRGTHTCTTSKGNSVRLFYQIYTADANPSFRRVQYNQRKKTIVESADWESPPPIRYLINASPKYFCATSDKMDLSCNKGSNYDYNNVNCDVLELN